MSDVSDVRLAGRRTPLVDAPPSDLIEEGSYISGRAVLSGAAVAAAMGIVLQGFGAAIGLGLSSASPTWRDTSTALVLVGGLYLLLVAIISFGVGGYISGRSASATPAKTGIEVEFRDGVNGLASWAGATLIVALLTLGSAAIGSKQALPTAPSASSSGEALLAFEIDKLFRSDRGEGELSYSRSEAARILLTANGHTGMTAEDRDYLVHLVARRTGLSAADAGTRVTQVSGEAFATVAKARHTAVILAFTVASAALVGALIAWAAAVAGGRHRAGLEPSHLWRWSRPAVRAP